VRIAVLGRTKLILYKQCDISWLIPQLCRSDGKSSGSNRMRVVDDEQICERVDYR
jgi:hypothetical protein